MNRIHRPLSTKLVKNRPNIKNIASLNELKSNENISLKKSINDSIDAIDNIYDNNININNGYNQFKVNIEDNISLIKQKIENTNEITIENKKEIQQVLKVIEQINSQILFYTQQTEDYKKITNDRIEKLAKLFIVINSKLQSKT